jgi:hypothetical protein
MASIMAAAKIQRVVGKRIETSRARVLTLVAAMLAQAHPITKAGRDVRWLGLRRANGADRIDCSSLAPFNRSGARGIAETTPMPDGELYKNCVT